MSVFPATRKAKTGGLLEPKSQPGQHKGILSHKGTNYVETSLKLKKKQKFHSPNFFKLMHNLFFSASCVLIKQQFKRLATITLAMESLKDSK
jgi:hypothetical protein